VNDLTKNILVFIVITVVLLSVVQGLSGVSGTQSQKKDYSEFLNQVRAGQVAVAVIEDKQIRFGRSEQHSNWLAGYEWRSIYGCGT